MDNARTIDLRKHAELTLLESEITANVSAFFDLSLASESDIYHFWFDSSVLSEFLDGFIVSYSASTASSTVVGDTLITTRGAITITSVEATGESFSIAIEQRQKIEVKTTYWTGIFCLHIVSSIGAQISITVLPSSRGSLSNLINSYIIPSTINKYIFA